MISTTYRDPEAELPQLLAELQQHNEASKLILDRLLKALAGHSKSEDVSTTSEATGSIRPSGWGSDWPNEDLSQLTLRKAIQRWLELLPNKRSATPAEIRAGLTAARPSRHENHVSTQQQIYQLALEGKIRRDGWGQYGALL